MLNQSCTFFEEEKKKKTPCNNSNNLQYNALSSEISYHLPGDNNVQFFFVFFLCVTGLDSAVRVFFPPLPSADIYGLLLLLYIARSFCYFVQPLQIVQPALPAAHDSDLLPIFN